MEKIKKEIATHEKKIATHEKKIKKQTDQCTISKSNISKKAAQNSNKVKKIEGDIKKIISEIKDKVERPRISVNKKEVQFQKSVCFRDDSGKTVLTDSTWEYVIFYLKQNKKQDDALFYWEQAYNFYKASLKLTNISKPLTTYYCFLNATKALLRHHSIQFSTLHGVVGLLDDNGQCKLQNEKMTIKINGVLPSLSKYLNEPITQKVSFNMKDVLYNMAFIHRAFQLTFNNPSNFAELFIPINEPKFVYDKKMKKGYLQFRLEPELSNKNTTKKLVGFEIDEYFDNKSEYVMRSITDFQWNSKSNKPTPGSLIDFKKYFEKGRKEFRYIYSPNELWYLKRSDLKNKKSIINRHDLILIFATMHRLSELSRYDPQVLKKHLESKHSWLLNEFINKSMLQFIDNIACEITGKNFRVTGFRT